MTAHIHRQVATEDADGCIRRPYDPLDTERYHDQSFIEADGVLFQPAAKSMLSLRADADDGTPVAITLSLVGLFGDNVALSLLPRDTRELAQSMLAAADEFDRLNALAASAALSRAAKGNLK